MKHVAVGIDIGGTFTDVVALDYRRGRVHAHKQLTTHRDPSQGVVDGLQALLHKAGILSAQVGRIVHATTLFTNALIEKKGAVTGLLTTTGFGDVIEIGRERRFDLYDVGIEAGDPVVPRHLRAEIPGRLDACGNELEALDQEEVIWAASTLVERGATSLAVCLLHAYASAQHEQQVACWIAERFPELSISVSSQVAPEIREYDRLCTTAANAYIKPISQRYLDALEGRLASLGIGCGVLMMLSNGGLCDVAIARERPIELLESGPAAGAIAAAHYGLRDRHENVLAFDMGGTTAKLCLVERGQPAVAYGFEAARRKRFAEGSGIPIRVTTVDLIEIGAGGGSIARSDGMRLLKVGPESAGSEPGPACYGRGAGQPTVTDANLSLGYLNPENFAGGSIRIDPSLAADALAGLAEKLGLTPCDTAAGIHDVVAENMAAAARVHVAERGHDPRDFAMVCTGGGGPLHAYGVARKIGVRTILCPADAGVASALGLLMASARSDRSRSVCFRPDRDEIGALEQTFQDLEREALASVGTLLDAFGPPLTARHGDGRFVGQGFTLTVVLPDGPYAGGGVDEADIRRRLAMAFEAAYREKFGRTPPDVPIELVNLRATVQAAPRQAFAAEPAAGTGEPQPRALRLVHFPELGDFVRTPVYDRDAIPVGASLSGPLLIEDGGSTLVAGPSARVECRATGSLVMTIDRAER